MINLLKAVFSYGRARWVQFLRDTSNPMSPDLIDHLTKLAELEGPRVRIPPLITTTWRPCMEVFYPDGGFIAETSWTNEGDTVGRAPDGSIVPPGKTVFIPGALKLRDYFIAHAPAEPQPWFRPEAPKRPDLPDFRNIADEAVRSDVERALRRGTDPTMLAAGRWLAQHCAARDAIQKWEAERERLRLVQWPGAWADEQLRLRGQWYAEHMRRQRAAAAEGASNAD